MGLELSAQKTRPNAYVVWPLTERIPGVAPLRPRARTTDDYSDGMRVSRRPRQASAAADAGSRPRDAGPPGPSVAARLRDFSDRPAEFVLWHSARLADSARWHSARMGAVVTPLRATLVVAVAAAVALAVSQFLDYRGVAVGAADYAAYPDIEPIAPPPQVERDPAGSAHAYLLLPVALAALLALALALRGRARLARLAAVLGAFSLAVVLIVDRPAGLDEGTTVRDFAGAEASLEYGFYIELAAAGVLLATSLIAARHARLARSRPRRRSARRPARAPRLREAGG